MCSELCMCKPCEELHSTLDVCGVHLFLSGHNFRASAKGEAWGGGEPYTFLPPAARSVLRQMDVTDPSQWSQQRGSRHFPDRGRPGPLSGGLFHIYLLLTQACPCWATITHTPRGSEWISWPPGVGVTGPRSLVSKHWSLQAAETGGWGGQGCSPGSGSGKVRDSSVSGTPTVSQHGSGVCSQSRVIYTE